MGNDRQKYTDWMSQSGYGVFFHYLYSHNEWKTFDVKGFVSQVEQTGAGWVVFTLGQNSGLYCAPNDTYEKIVGAGHGEKCSLRDIPMEIADALAEKNIRLMLYLPSNPPFADNEAGRKIGAEKKINENSDWISNDRVVENWSEIIKDWSIRYGKKISGWWFDGYYEWLGLGEKQCSAYRKAATAGNEESIVALNQGVQDRIYPANSCCDYTAGEETEFALMPEERFAGDAQWHILSFLGKDWGNPTPKYDGEYLAEYIENVMKKGGAVSVDLHINGDGSLQREQLEVMKAVKDRIR